ncbi:MAG: hypothetical protein K0R48_840 [Gammaproteobacteria bacterium]|jgi:long-subunit fatty acid transport protein|nr:hypothetical protein [Gammaproteobacteria bacterium]
MNKRAILAAVFLTYSGISNAEVMQTFGFSSENPAQLQFIENNQLILGGTYLFLREEATGTFNGEHNSATASKDPQFILPQFRYASRLSPKLVVALDVNQPIYSIAPWPADAFIAPLGYGAEFSSLSFAPKLSYAITDSFTIGVSGAATHTNAELDLAAAPAGFLETEASGWGYNYQIGAMYKINPQTFIDASYISKMRTALEGNSTFAGNYNSNLKTNDFNFIPDTYTVALTRFMTQKWLTKFELDYSEWSEDSELVLNNTAFISPNLTFPLAWDDTWRFVLTNHYQFTDKTGGFLSLGYETSPVSSSSNNYASFPLSNLGSVVMGVDRNLTPSAKVSVFVGDIFFMPDATSTLAPNSNLKISTNAYIVGGNLTFNW